MLKKNIIPLLTASLLMVVAFNSCKKTDSAPATNMINDFYPLQLGKYITYKLDSTVYINLNTQKTVRSYFVQDFVDAEIIDNLGNKGYRIRRMMRSKTDTTQWFDNATFIVIPSRKDIQFSENNLKFIKLVNPVTELNTWAGNSYINTDDNLLRFYENWEYFYENIDQPFVVNNQTFDSTITVNQSDMINGDPSNKNFFYAITKSSETYAKGVGLIYKEFLYEAWQPSTQNYEANSYGVKLTILNHN
jgi:hypothetical protein